MSTRQAWVALAANIAGAVTLVVVARWFWQWHRINKSLNGGGV